MMRSIDIIIPVYNALDDLKICLSSVYRHTDLDRHRIILINDNSTDPNVRVYLDKENEQIKNLFVLHNECNMGFSANINKGMDQSREHDVILLNSDTVVTKGWVEKLVSCAYSGEEIGTATPLSNNATICSVPEFCKENELPEGFTVDGMGKLVESCSLKRYPDIRVAVGFCMYIKREVIDLIGNFDAETFEKGYEEENDFCFRASQYGFKNVLCDDTYIYHSGSKSFVSKEKQRNMETHERIVEDRYPKLKAEIRKHVQENPNRLIQENIKQYTRLKNGRKNILYLLQSDFREDSADSVGGIQLHVRDLTENLKKDFNVFVAARNGSNLQLTIYINDAPYSYKFHIGSGSVYPRFSDAGLKKIYRDILNAFHIDVVHIHHTLSLSLELYFAACEHGIPVYATIHDYYTVCPTIKMLDTENNICYTKDAGSSCGECLGARLGMYRSQDYLDYYRGKNREALSLCRNIFVPSESTKETIQYFYPELKDKIIRLDHGVDSEEQTDQSKKKREDGLFHVAFIGGINEEKGSRLVYDVVKNGPKDIKWYILGSIGDRELAYLNQKNLVKTGPYRREHLPGLLDLHQIDLICIFSAAPESYCYTLSEAVANRIPVLVTDVGAIGERVRAMKCGLVLSPKPDAQEVLAVLEDLKKRGKSYAEIKDRTERIHLKSVEQMCREYRQVYEDHLNANIEYKPYDAKNIFYAYLYGKNKTNELYSEWELEMLERMDTAEGRLDAIYQSVTYKLAGYIAKLPVPGRSRLKAALYRIYKKRR